eukprot:Pompholyxophrys_punicea_v1_NODE_465_length_1897_cov_12.178610.p3 type:complete len:126 gc:universal NODE_465_length_1897_cov_12.178610:1452-1829(+)
MEDSDGSASDSFDESSDTDDSDLETADLKPLNLLNSSTPPFFRARKESPPINTDLLNEDILIFLTEWTRAKIVTFAKKERTFRLRFNKRQTKCAMDVLDVPLCSDTYYSPRELPEMHAWVLLEKF